MHGAWGKSNLHSINLKCLIDIQEISGALSIMEDSQLFNGPIK